MNLLTGLWLSLQAAAAPADSVVGVVRAVLRAYPDTGSARSAGFVPLAVGRFTGGTPFQGIHWIHPRWFRSGAGGLSQPTFLLFAPVRGRLQLVGAAYSERIGAGADGPAGIGAAPAEWHRHQACFGVPGIGFLLADGLDDCDEMGGLPAPRQTAMVHVWSGPASPEGPFSHDNVALPFAALGLAVPAGSAEPVRPLAVALADSYGFRVPFVKRLDVSAARSPLQSDIARQRQAIARLVPDLRTAQAREDGAAYRALAARVTLHGDSLRALYGRLAPTPEYRHRLEAQYAQALGTHRHH